MPTLPRPTDAELAILRGLWKRGASTVREVHEVIADRRSLAYTTTLKLLQIMTDKGLVRRDASSRTHVFHAARSGRDAVSWALGPSAPLRRRIRAEENNHATHAAHRVS